MAIADIIAADRVVCRCLGITESEIRSALMEGTAECLRTVMRKTGAGTGCTCCHRAIRDLLDRERLQERLSSSVRRLCVFADLRDQIVLESHLLDQIQLRFEPVDVLF